MSSTPPLPLADAALNPYAAPGPVRGSGPWMVLLAAFFGWMFDGLELGLFPLTARPALTELLSKSHTAEQLKTSIGTWMGVTGALTLLGAAFGGVAFGWLGDRIGRVRTLAWAVLTYSLFAGLCAVVNAPWQLAGLRLLASLGMGGEWAVGVALVMEVWPSKSRPALAATIGVASNVGFLSIALLGLALSKVLVQLGAALHAIHLPDPWVHTLLANSGWRVLFLLGALPALLTFFVRVFVPESARWQHAAATEPVNRLSDIFRGGIGHLTILGATLSGIALLGTWGSVQWIASWADKLVRDPGRAASARSSAQIAVSLGAVVACIVSTPMLKWAPRRVGYFALSMLSLLTCAYLFDLRGFFHRHGLRPEQHYGNSFLVLVFLAGGFTAAFYAWLPLYLPELFPTRVRATAQGFAYNFGRVIAAAGTLGAGALLNYFREDYAKMCSYISLIYVAGLVVIWFCPETKGRPLPE
jgi:SHS family sialic acid transporter-like MFS transporter